jgi:hypothetical protein
VYCHWYQVVCDLLQHHAAVLLIQRGRAWHYLQYEVAHPLKYQQYRQLTPLLFWQYQQHWQFQVYRWSGLYW